MAEEYGIEWLRKTEIDTIANDFEALYHHIIYNTEKYNFPIDLDGKEKIENMINNLPKMGLEKVINLLYLFEKDLQLSKNAESFELCDIIQSLIKYFTKNVLDKTPFF